MARHFDLVPNPVRRGGTEPYLCVLQSDATADRRTRVVAPVALGMGEDPLSPALRHEGREYRVLLRGVTNLPTRLLGTAVGSAEAVRDEITRGLDLLFLGV